VNFEESSHDYLLFFFTPFIQVMHAILILVILVQSHLLLPVCKGTHLAFNKMFSTDLKQLLHHLPYSKEEVASQRLAFVFKGHESDQLSGIEDEEDDEDSEE